LISQVEEVVKAFLIKHGCLNQSLPKPVPVSPLAPPLQFVTLKKATSTRLPLTEKRPTEDNMSILHNAVVAKIVHRQSPPDVTIESACACEASRRDAPSVPQSRQLEAKRAVTATRPILQTGVQLEPRTSAASIFTSVDQQARPVWLRQALEGWSNPTFPSNQPSLSKLASAVPSESYNPSYSKDLRQISKESLKGLVFLEQVDSKFLLCRIDRPDGDSSLFLVDQHAADERVRVEQLLKTYCAEVADGQIRLHSLDSPKPILLDATTARKAEMHAREFGRWGIQFQIGNIDGAVGQVYIQAVPAVVAPRLQNDANMVIRLIKDYCNKLAVNGAPRIGSSWTSTIRHAPSVLVDLLNSRACRGVCTAHCPFHAEILAPGAIMFNDVLEKERCESLLLSLQATDFPFICAHGRYV
jgi:DNA mismatch repair ATPase MutL